MEVSASYICPSRGLATLDPPDPGRLHLAGEVAKDLGLKKLLFPVLEESLIRNARERVRFLDGLIVGLDQMAGADLEAWLIAPAQKILGLDWVPPHLARATPDPGADPVFLGGRVRKLRPYNWWTDPSVVQERIRFVRELVIAVTGHPALRGWIVMDRALEWIRPEPGAANLVLRSYLAEIRDRDEDAPIYLGLGWNELLQPALSGELADLVDGIKMNGLDKRPEGLSAPGDPRGETLVSSYIGALCHWIFNKPVEVVFGWRILNSKRDKNGTMEAISLFSAMGISGIIWPSLVDPEPRLIHFPPWTLEPDLSDISLLDASLEPKGPVQTLLRKICSSTPEVKSLDFIDISRKEYMEDPVTHFNRLWDHFRESVDL